MILRKRKIENAFLNFLLIFLLLIIYYPYVFSDIFHSPLRQTGYVLLVGFIVGVQLLFAKNIDRSMEIVEIVFALEIISCLLLFLYHGMDVNYIAAMATYGVTFISILVIKEKIGFINFIKYYNAWMVIMAIGAVVTFFLAFINVPPVFNYTNGDGTQGLSWILSCAKVDYAYYASSIIRPSGYFDEPGALATWGMFAMIFNKLFVKNNKTEFILMMCLLFTFSMAYYILLTGYILVFYVKKFKYFLCIILVLGAVGYSVYITKYNIIYELTLGRFQFNYAKALFVGDNRSAIMAFAERAFIQNPVMGVGPVASSNLGYINDNPYTLLAINGIFGIFFIYLPLFCVLWLGIKKKEIEIIGSIIILFISYMQRPFSYAFYIQYLMLFLFFVMCFEKYYKSGTINSQPTNDSYKSYNVQNLSHEI